MIEIRYRIVHDDRYIELTKQELENLRIEINTLLTSSITVDPTLPVYPLPQYPTYEPAFYKTWVGIQVPNPVNPEW